MDIIGKLILKTEIRMDEDYIHPDSEWFYDLCCEIVEENPNILTAHELMDIVRAKIQFQRS